MATTDLGAELPERGQTVVAVRRPVLSPPSAPHHDHRVEIAAELVHGRGQPLDVRLGEIALVRGGLDLVDREGGEDLPVAAERVLVGGEHGAAVGLDGLGQAGHGCGRGAGADGIGRDAARAGLGGRFLLAPWLPLALARGMLGCLRLGHKHLRETGGATRTRSTKLRAGIAEGPNFGTGAYREGPLTALRAALG